ncbi:MAG: helix-turn-helix domain-containing protein [Candidatus Velamenicoccus archaeovorus]
MEPTGLPELLTVPEVAKVLRRSRSSTYELLKAGEIPAVKIGRRGVRVRRESLEIFIRESETGTTAGTAA